MSHTNRNFVLAYIFLVGLPLLGLVAVLKGGRTLTAPFSVDGSWKVESSHPASSSCSDFISATDTPISISQSGPSLVIALNGGLRTASGTLKGKVITAQFAGTATNGREKSSTGCGDGSLVLNAALDPLTEPRTIQGTFSAPDCVLCVPIEFHAIRQPKMPGGTR